MEKEIVIAGKYFLGSKIESGAFADLYLGKNLQTKEICAIKLELVNSKYPQVIYEGKVYKYLEGEVGIPKMLWCGSEGDYNILVMELLGNTLEDLFFSCNKMFSLKTILQIGIKIINLFQYIHSKFFVYRDIKPDNFLIGLGSKANIIHIIDFGLTKRYIDPVTNMHGKVRKNRSLTGVARYASINTHMGLEQSRRDDLESLFYMLLYFKRPGLPWQGVPIENKEEKLKRISEIKISMSVDLLSKGCPIEFGDALKYIKELEFDEEPNYVKLITLLSNVFIKNKFQDDGLYDWNTQQSEEEINDPFKFMMKRKAAKNIAKKNPNEDKGLKPGMTLIDNENPLGSPKIVYQEEEEGEIPPEEGQEEFGFPDEEIHDEEPQPEEEPKEKSSTCVIF